MKDFAGDTVIQLYKYHIICVKEKNVQLSAGYTGFHQQLFLRLATADCSFIFGSLTHSPPKLSWPQLLSREEVPDCTNVLLSMGNPGLQFSPVGFDRQRLNHGDIIRQNCATCLFSAALGLGDSCLYLLYVQSFRLGMAATNWSLFLYPLSIFHPSSTPNLMNCRKDGMVDHLGEIGAHGLTDPSLRITKSSARKTSQIQRAF